MNENNEITDEKAQQALNESKQKRIEDAKKEWGETSKKFRVRLWPMKVDDANGPRFVVNFIAE